MKSNGRNFFPTFEAPQRAAAIRLSAWRVFFYDSGLVGCWMFFFHFLFRQDISTCVSFLSLARVRLVSPLRLTQSPLVRLFLGGKMGGCRGSASQYVSGRSMLPILKRSSKVSPSFLRSCGLFVCSQDRLLQLIIVVMVRAKDPHDRGVAS